MPSIERLNFYYDQVKRQILQHQSLTHGLFPLNINATPDQAVGHVRDNIYCATCVWALALAYRHVDDDAGRTFELEHSAVKCMRGLLFFYMQQADKVESFKKDQQSEHSLACIFNIHTADVMKNEAYHDLQIDVIALYILTMVQMIASGLNLIFTTDEVHFIQNLVYYIERTYRIADFGIWGRGTKYNDGHSELHASSIGMVKAALEAVNGFNLFGSKGSVSSVIYVDTDAYQRNRSFLHSLLPRESNSKDTDSALLSVIGYPAFAVDDKSLRQQTKERIIERLGGRFGLKRFQRDGYGTVPAESIPKYYQRSELKQFAGIECEWPIFYVYLALEAIFSGDATGGPYMGKLESLLLFTKYGKTIPQYYYVCSEDIEIEREAPGEALRWANDDAENTFLWGQSLYFITNMLVEKLISIHELDPLNRSGYGSARYGYAINHRYSSFQADVNDLVIQVCLIAENRNLQANLATYGIKTQTPKEIEPIVVCPPHDLVRVYEDLGKNPKLKLSGRPKRPIGSLGTSKLYKILGKIVVTYPLHLDEVDFYMSLDMSLLIDELKSCLVFIRRCWNMRGRPTVCFLLRDHNFRGLHASEMVDFMAELKNGEVRGVKVKLGRMQTFTSTACVEHLDYLTPQHCNNINVITNAEEEGHFFTPTGFESVYNPVSVTDNESDDENTEFIRPYNQLNTNELLTKLQNSLNLHMKMTILQLIVQREGRDFIINEKSVTELIKDVYLKACYVHNWSVVRHGACFLDKTVPSLAPSITAMLVGGKQVAIGAFGQREFLITEPMTPAAIKQAIYDTCMEYDPREVSLQQEMVIHLAGIISTRPKLFNGMLIIRIGWILQAMKNWLLSSKQTIPGKSGIYTLYPNEVLQLATAVLAGEGEFRKTKITTKNIFEKRRLEGALNRVPTGFYKKVWDILERVDGLQLNERLLQSDQLLAEMTADEVDFRVNVEAMLSESANAVDIQISVELIVVLWSILNRNPEVKIPDIVSITELIADAVNMYITKYPSKTKKDFLLLESNGNSGTMSYLARAILQNVLRQDLLLDASDSCILS